MTCNSRHTADDPALPLDKSGGSDGQVVGSSFDRLYYRLSLVVPYVEMTAAKISL